MWGPPVGISTLVRKWRRERAFSRGAHTEERPCERTAGRQLSVSQEDGPHRTLNL